MPVRRPLGQQVGFGFLISGFEAIEVEHGIQKSVPNIQLGHWIWGDYQPIHAPTNISPNG